MPGAIEVASLMATLRLEDTMTGALGNAERGITRIGDQIERAGGRISGFGASIQSAIAPLVSFGQQGVGVAMEFESAMAEISARTGLFGDDMTRIQDYALRMGEETAYSAQEAANAFLQLLSSGQSAEEAIATLPAVLNAAAASGGDLGATADAVTDILNMYSMSALDAGLVSESLARASGASSATMTDLFDAFQNVGSTAARFGMDVNDTAAALAVMAENGVKGAEAGTALNSMFNSLDDATAVEAFNELGVNLYDAQGEIRDMNTVLQELGSAMDELPAERVNTLMTDIAGSYGSRALDALSSGFSDMEGSMDSAASASEIAEGRMDTMAGAVDTLQGSIETLQIEVLTPFMNETLRPLVEGLTEIVTQVTEWATANPDLINTLGEVLLPLAGIAAIMLPAGMFISGLGTVITLVGGLAGAFGGALLPIFAVATAIAAVVAQVNEFNRIAGEGAAAAGEAYAASGMTREELDAIAFSSVAENFGGGFLGDVAARLTYSNFADSVEANAGVPGRAAGGNVSAGMPYVVGERGPELLVPSSNGTIIPNHALGGQTLNVYVNAYGATPHEFAELVDRALRDRGR